MAKKNDKAPASTQEELPAPEVSQDTPEAETASAAAGDAVQSPLSQPAADSSPRGGAEEAGTILYLVSAPRGIYLRVGPGRAYRELGVLENGEEVMGRDLSGMLRANRRPGEAAWVEVTSKNGSGWVDSAFLDRCF